MKTGIYEEIINRVLARHVEQAGDRAQTQRLRAEDSSAYLSQYLYRVLAQGLAQVQPQKGLSTQREKNDSKIQNQISICNEIIRVLESRGVEDLNDLEISPVAKQLIAILEDASRKILPSRPDTPLTLGCLLTGTCEDPSLVSQLQKEILSADKVDILCSFIKWSGIRILKEALETFTQESSSVRLRIITTSYLGATQLLNKSG